MKKQFPNEAEAYIYVVQRWSIPRPGTQDFDRYSFLEERNFDEGCKDHPSVKDPETEELRKELSTHDFVQPGVHYRDVNFKTAELQSIEPKKKEFKIWEWILDKAQMLMLIFVVFGCELVLFYLFVLFVQLCDRLFL